MGKAEAAGDHVDSDYSGRPLGRPTRKEVEAAPQVPAHSAIRGELPDGRRTVVGPGGKWYYEHVVRGRQVFDQPFNPEDYEDKEGQ